MAKRTREENETLSQYIMRDCKERGLDHFFGIPGSGSPMDIMDAARANGVDFVIMGHESLAVFAAAYYGLFKRTAGLFVGIKGVGAGNASYYYAQTRMATTGTITLPGGEAVPVEGLTWFDREWSTSALGAGQVGWD